MHPYGELTHIFGCQLPVEGQRESVSCSTLEAHTSTLSDIVKMERMIVVHEVKAYRKIL